MPSTPGPTSRAPVGRRTRPRPPRRAVGRRDSALTTGVRVWRCRAPVVPTTCPAQRRTGGNRRYCRRPKQPTNHQLTTRSGCSTHLSAISLSQIPKLNTRVRFPSSAPQSTWSEVVWSGYATVAVPRPCHFGVRYRSDFGRTVRHAARKSWLPRSSSDRKRRGETCPHDRRRVTTCDEVGQSSSSECRIQNELGQPSCRVSRLPFIETESGFDKPSPTSMLSQDHRQCPPEQANLIEWHLERSCLLGMDSSHLAAGAPVVASMTSATSPMYFSQIRPPGRYGRPQPINS